MIKLITKSFSRQKNRTQHKLILFSILAGLTSSPVVADIIGPDSSSERAEKAYQLRINAAEKNRNDPEVAHPSNNDESEFANKLNNYSKGLPHNENGIVDSNAYQKMFDA